MDRRTLLASALTGLALPAAAKTRTRWTVRGSEGFDALCFLGPLSGKDFYARYYRQELAAFLPRFNPAARRALAALQSFADGKGQLLGPGLCTIFSGGPDATLDDLIAALDAAETRLQPSLHRSLYWDDADWAAFLAGRPQLRTVLTGLREAGFSALRRKSLALRLESRAPTLQRKVAGLDVIAEQERLLGRRLDPSIEVILLWFSKPHGIRIQGQRFLTHVDYPDTIVLQNAAHEILHPPFSMDGPAAKAALGVLAADPLLTRVIAEHNHDFGYNQLDGLLNEDAVQALEQIVSERLGFAGLAARRWAEADDGMHILAAGLYGLLKADGYDRTGGNLERWMMAAARSGKLAPAPLHAAAATVLEIPIDKLWPRKPA